MTEIVKDTQPVPQFGERNSTRAEFWDERFEQQFTPWDKGTVPAQLHDFVRNGAGLVPSQLPPQPPVNPRRCFIPGCGSAYEVVALAQAGWEVTAIDFSARAVQQAKSQIGPWAHCVSQADFFTWHEQHPQPRQQAGFDIGFGIGFDIIYERAFLCALPRVRWPEIVAQWHNLLRPGGLLLGFFYFDPHPGGPPFGADPEQLGQLFAPHFQLLSDQAVNDSIGPFQGKERWQIWQRKG